MLVKPPKPATTPPNPGCVDFIAYCGTLDGWMVCGWIAAAWVETERPPVCTLTFSDRAVTGDGILCLFAREDVAGIGSGFILHLYGDQGAGRHDLADLRLRAGGQDFSLAPGHGMEQPAEAAAITRARALLAGAPPSERRARLLKMLNRPAYAGQETLHLLKTPVFLEIDSAVLCPPAGLLLRGWFVDPFRQVAALRIRCANRSATIDPAEWVTVLRTDAIERVAVSHEVAAERAGYMVFVPDIAVAGAPCYAEVELLDGEVGFKGLPPLRSPGLPTIKDMLAQFDLRYQDMVRAYDKVVGPAVTALNAFRMAEKTAIREMVFGDQPTNPACSIIIPLYGRIDFMEYQLAFFARTLAPNHELIYVLDDPPLLRDTENLAASCLARFNRPFRLLAAGANRGYAPANNVGMAHARAPYLCFLNSDVFPKRADWLDCLLQTLAADQRIGIAGALLLYEDDAIQHTGCRYASLPEFGGWQFCLHPQKGRALTEDESVLEVEAVTGACLVIATERARALGGFDETYVIGDFEDADFCRKVQAQGLACVVDRRAQLYHLERQSQGGQQNAWRLNLTLFNAWTFHQRWGGAARPGTVLAGKVLGHSAS